MPIRSRDEMRRAISGSAQLAQPTWSPMSEQQIYLQRQGAAMGGGRGSGGRAVPERMGPYVPAGMAGGSLIGPPAPTLGSAQPAVQQRSVVAPGQGAPAPVVTPVSRARAEALNTASQQAGGPNLSKPIVPTEAEAQAQREFAAAREANPLAAVPELLDQRSQAYGQRAGIDQWLKAMQGGSKSDQEIARRFLAKQRSAGPSAMQADPAGVRAAFGSDLDVGPGARGLDEAAFKGGIEPAAGDELRAAYQSRPQGMGGGSLEGLAYEGPAPVSQPAAMQHDEAGLQAAFGGGLSVAPQASAQQSNLNGPESPLKDAVLSQSAADQKKNFQMQLGSELLNKYRFKANELNGYWRG